MSEEGPQGEEGFGGYARPDAIGASLAPKGSAKEYGRNCCYQAITLIENLADRSMSVAFLDS